MRNLKILFTLSIFFCTLSSLSQSKNETLTSPTSKGNYIIGGSSGFNFSSVSLKIKSDSLETQDLGLRETSLSLTPIAGYFLIDDLAIGLGLSLILDKSKSDEFNFKSTNTTFIFTPFIRYYFTKGTIKPFLQGNLGIGTSNSTNEFNSQETESKNSVFNYGFDGGVAFFLSNLISIDVGVGYISSSSKPKDSNESNTRIISSGFNFNTGITIFLK